MQISLMYTLLLFMLCRLFPALRLRRVQLNTVSVYMKTVKIYDPIYIFYFLFCRLCTCLLHWRLYVTITSFLR